METQEEVLIPVFEERDDETFRFVEMRPRVTPPDPAASVPPLRKKLRVAYLVELRERRGQLA